jgi:hypothetical protein
MSTMKQRAMEATGFLWVREARNQLALEPGNGRTALGLGALAAGAFLVGGWMAMLVPLVVFRLVQAQVGRRAGAARHRLPGAPRAAGLR